MKSQQALSNCTIKSLIITSSKINFIIKYFISLFLINLNNIPLCLTSERQHPFRGRIMPNVYTYNGIVKPILWKIEVKCLHGCDNAFRFYLQSTIDDVEKAGLFEILLVAGSKNKRSGYKKITELRVYIRSMDLLAGQHRVKFKQYFWKYNTE